LPLAAVKPEAGVTDTKVQVEADALVVVVDKVIFVISSLQAVAVAKLAKVTGSGLIGIVIVKASPIQPSALTGFNTYTTSIAALLIFVNLSFFIAVALKPKPAVAFPLAAVKDEPGVTDTKVQVEADALVVVVDKVTFVISSLHTAEGVDKLANVTGSGLMVEVIVNASPIHPSALTGFTTYTTVIAALVMFVNLSFFIAVALKPKPAVALPLAAVKLEPGVTDTKVHEAAAALPEAVDKVIFDISSLQVVDVDKLAKVNGSGLIATVMVKASPIQPSALTGFTT
jgi:hypothetical protein